MILTELKVLTCSSFSIRIINMLIFVDDGVKSFINIAMIREIISCLLYKICILGCYYFSFKNTINDGSMNITIFITQYMTLINMVYIQGTDTELFINIMNNLENLTKFIIKTSCVNKTIITEVTSILSLSVVKSLLSRILNFSPCALNFNSTNWSWVTLLLARLWLACKCLTS